MLMNSAHTGRGSLTEAILKKGNQFVFFLLRNLIFICRDLVILQSSSADQPLGDDKTEGLIVT